MTGKSTVVILTGKNTFPNSPVFLRSHTARQRFGSHMPALRFLVFGLTILFAALAPCSLSADEGFAGALRWRNVGPFRGGRTRAIAGVPSQPNVFYMAQVNGGVFKTIDYGRTWWPIFDDQPTGSGGALAVS